MAQVTTLHANGVMGIPHAFTAKTPASAAAVLWETDHDSTLGEQRFLKGVAVDGFPFLLFTPAGAAVTTGTPTGYVTGDDGVQATVAATPVHKGGGQWTVDLSATEMDADMIGLVFSHVSAVSTQAWLRTR